MNSFLLDIVSHFLIYSVVVSGAYFILESCRWGYNELKNRLLRRVRRDALRLKSYRRDAPPPIGSIKTPSGEWIRLPEGVTDPRLAA